MDKEAAYRLVILFLDTGEFTATEFPAARFIDRLYDQGYVIESRLVGEDSYQQRVYEEYLHDRKKKEA